MSFYDFTIEENIRRYLTRLDQVQVEYESRWGVNKLPLLCSEELQSKWQRQKEKLQQAVEADRLADVVALVDGSIRAFDAMEKQAIANGHKMHDAEMWDFKHPEDGTVYRIVKNNYDAGIAIGDGAKVYTLEEVARLLHKYDNLNAVKDAFPDATVMKVTYTPDDFNDPIPF